DFDVITLRLELTPRERAAYERDMALFRPVYAAFRRLIPSAAGADFARFARRTDAGRQAFEALRRVQRLLALTEAKRQVVGVLVRRHAAARVLVFTADNASAYAIAREHLVMPLTCDIARREREEVLGRFRDGELRALVSARVLNEGLDVPEADVAVVVGGSLGRREHVQRVGRLLRPREGKWALVYELVTARTLEVRWAAHRRAGLGARSAADGYPPRRDDRAALSRRARPPVASVPPRRARALSGPVTARAGRAPAGAAALRGARGKAPARAARAATAVADGPAARLPGAATSPNGGVRGSGAIAERRTHRSGARRGTARGERDDVARGPVR